MIWADLKFPPINLYNIPKPCQHTAWLMLYSMSKRICYDCGKESKITNAMPIHQR